MPRKKEVISGNFVKYDAVVLGSGPAGEGAKNETCEIRQACCDCRYA